MFNQQNISPQSYNIDTTGQRSSGSSGSYASSSAVSQNSAGKLINYSS